MEDHKNDTLRNRMDYNNAYNRNNYRSFSIRFNQKTEREIIHWLESKHSIKSYITELILNDMRKR
ncbi:MAG: hypothetical protein PUE44_07175 [Bulleidia sp.]|nr:hypothetical protein [Bulleidia sp.]HAW13531.1 hypothetical protein [Erysipelotrichaceae bacterium]